MIEPLRLEFDLACPQAHAFATWTESFGRWCPRGHTVSGDPASVHRDDSVDPPELVCTVGSTKLRYLARCLEDVPAMLRQHGDWMELGSADENKPAKPGTLETWARAADNPVGGWYGLRKGYRGRFAMYVPPLLEHLGLVELEHQPRNTRIRAR